MRERSTKTDRILFLRLYCFIGIFSVAVWFSIASVFPKSAAMNTMAEIPVNETVRAVWDSGLYRAEVVRAGLFWLDNDTIVVSANKGPKPLTPEELRTQEDWLYLWRLGEKPQPYGADPHAMARTYCAARGKISYHLDIISPITGATSRTRRLGPPGQEREAAPWIGISAGKANNPPSIERTDCELFFDPAMVGKNYVTDSEHRFYLDFGKDQDMAAVHAGPEEPIVLMHADGSGRIALPISNALVGSGSAHFHTFDGIFYLMNGVLGVSPINHFAIWRETNCWPIWRVDPQTAKTERLCIPFGPWSGAMRGGSATSLQLAATRAGLFFGANPVSAAEEHGFYRLNVGTVSRILPGYVWSPTVSPNGCRVAFAYVPGDDAYRPYSPVSSSIVAIDLCSPEPDSTSRPSSRK
jgi:hypothetical protein